MFKPVTHVGWYHSDIVVEAGAKPFKALLAETREEFLTLWNKMNLFDRDFVIQEYVPGDDNCIYSFHAYLDEHSRPLGSFVGRKIRTYPKRSGREHLPRARPRQRGQTAWSGDPREDEIRRPGEARLQERRSPRDASISSR